MAIFKFTAIKYPRPMGPYDLKGLWVNVAATYSTAILTIFAVAKIEVALTKTQSPARILKLVQKSPAIPPKAISKTGIISGNTITPIIGAEFPKVERLPHKLQIKLIAKLAKKIKIKKLITKSFSNPSPIPSGKIEIKIGKQQTSQFPSILAKIKISKFSQEVKTCSMVPSSKSFFKNSAAEKIKQKSSENQIIVTE